MLRDRRAAAGGADARMDEPRPKNPSFLEGQRLARRAANTPIKVVTDHWLNLHDGTRLPVREQLDPTELPPGVWPYLFLLERVPPTIWRVRLMGSHLVTALGQDFTGCDMVDEQIPGITQSRTLRMLGEVTETSLPMHFHGRSGFRLRDDLDDHEQILLPFRRSEDDTVGMVLGAILFEGLLGSFGPGANW